MATAISPPAAGPPIDNHGAVSYLRVKADLHQQLLSDLDRRNLINAGEEDLAEVVEDFVDQALDGQDLALNDSERRQLVDDLLEETLGVGPLAPLLADPAVTDVLVNGPYRVFIERFGRLEATDVRFRDAEHLVRIIQRIAARVARRGGGARRQAGPRHLPDRSR